MNQVVQGEYVLQHARDTDNAYGSGLAMYGKGFGVAPEPKVDVSLTLHGKDMGQRNG